MILDDMRYMPINYAKHDLAITLKVFRTYLNFYQWIDNAQCFFCESKSVVALAMEIVKVYQIRKGNWYPVHTLKILTIELETSKVHRRLRMNRL